MVSPNNVPIVTTGDATPLWRPSSPTTTRTHALLQTVNLKFSLELKTYEDLWKWSIASPAEFWDVVWDETGVVGTKGVAPVSVHPDRCKGVRYQSNV